MKRSYDSFYSDPGGSLSRKRQNRKAALSSYDFLQYTWNSNQERPKVNTNRSIHNEEAFESCQISFHEILNRMVCHLKPFGIVVAKSHAYTRVLDSFYICELLSDTDNKMVSLVSSFSSNSSIHLNGKMLLYALCHLFSCRIYLFSTRGKAVIIQPKDKILQEIPTFYILQHTDSYLKRLPTSSLQAEEVK